MNNLPLEIEYKFLIKMPDVEVLKAQPDFREKKLTQLYLELPKGLSEHGRRCRIRKTEENDKVSFRKTFKKSVTDLTRVEIEEDITEAEFLKLSQYIRKGTAPVVKTRLTFSFKGYTCEVDIFPFWSDKAFLEIEVESESVLPPVPDFIEIIRDVSTDKAYRNSALAYGIFDGSLT